MVHNTATARVIKPKASSNSLAWDLAMARQTRTFSCFQNTQTEILIDFFIGPYTGMSYLLKDSDFLSNNLSIQNMSKKYHVCCNAHNPVT
jgi:hypothetical protein